MAWNLEKKLCLNDTVVPLESVAMDFDDIHSLLPDLEASEHTFSLLSLKATEPGLWLTKLFKPNLKFAQRRQWWSRLPSMPLLQEITSAIAKGKQNSGLAARLPRRPKLVVAIEIRGKVILVVNHTRHITLAFQEGQEAEYLDWFLTELRKDIEDQGEDQDQGEDLQEGDENLEEDEELDEEVVYY